MISPSSTWPSRSSWLLTSTRHAFRTTLTLLRASVLKAATPQGGARIGLVRNFFTCDAISLFLFRPHITYTWYFIFVKSNCQCLDWNPGFSLFGIDPCLTPIIRRTGQWILCCDFLPVCSRHFESKGANYHGPKTHCVQLHLRFATIIYTQYQWIQHRYSLDLNDFVLGKAGEYQVIMKKIELDLVPQHVCENQLRATRLGQFFNLDKSFTCAGGKPGKDTCTGN